MDRRVEGLLDGWEVGDDVWWPGEGYRRERFGDDEAVPGVEFPAAVGESVVCANPGGTAQLSELNGAGLGYHVGAAWAVGGEGADVAFGVGLGHGAEPGSSAAGG